MFRSAVLKLTAWFVAALFLVCITFSVPIYNIAAGRLQRGAERQTEFVRRLPPGNTAPNNFFDQLKNQREEQLEKDRKELLSSLIITNLAFVLLGAVASYWFAKRTLQPIEQAHLAQVRFTADASHELRTPLSVMQTEIEVALRQKNITIAEAKEILGSNLEEVARLRRLSDQLLSLTRAGVEPIKHSSVDGSNLVSAAVKKLEKRHKLTISKEIAPGIILDADPDLLRQVIDIIIDNAVIYCSTDPSLTVTLKKAGGLAHISIADKGEGIDAKDLPHIFDRFYRGKQATKFNSDGHGLGLALAKDIAQRHGGELSVKSVMHTGTTFIISLPLCDDGIEKVKGGRV